MKSQTYRILHMLPDLQMGGGQQVLLQNITHMDRERFVNYVCYLLPFHDMESLFARNGIALLFLCHRWWSWPWVLLRLVKFIRRQGIDLVHVQGTPIDKFYGQAAALLSRRPVVRTLHGMMPKSKSLLEVLKRPRPKRLYWIVKDRFHWALDRVLEPLTIRHVIAVSDAVCASWSSYLRARDIDRSRITVIYNAVPLEKFGAPPTNEVLARLRRDLQIDSAYPILINVGRLSPAKGQDILIGMMPSVVQRWPDAKLLLVGEGNLRATLESAARTEGLERSVMLLGQRLDVAALLALSDVFVFTSRWEGLPLVVLEAMAAGKPVVAIDLPGLSSVVRDGQSGYLVQNRGAEALAEAILAVASDREQSRMMGYAGRCIVERDYSMHVSLQKLESVYLLVLENGRAADFSARDEP